MIVFYTLASDRHPNADDDGNNKGNMAVSKFHVIKMP
jgi:hypothetical protein